MHFAKYVVADLFWATVNVDGKTVTLAINNTIQRPIHKGFGPRLPGAYERFWGGVERRPWWKFWGEDILTAIPFEEAGGYALLEQ